MKHITTITIQVITEDGQPGLHIGMMPVKVADNSHVLACVAVQELFATDLPARLKSSGIQSAQLINAADFPQIATARAAMAKLVSRKLDGPSKHYNNGVLDAINCLPKS